MNADYFAFWSVVMAAFAIIGVLVVKELRAIRRKLGG